MQVDYTLSHWDFVSVNCDPRLEHEGERFRLVMEKRYWSKSLISITACNNLNEGLPNPDLNQPHPAPACCVGMRRAGR